MATHMTMSLERSSEATFWVTRKHAACRDEYATCWVPSSDILLEDGQASLLRHEAVPQRREFLAKNVETRLLVLCSSSSTLGECNDILKHRCDWKALFDQPHRVLEDVDGSMGPPPATSKAQRERATTFTKGKGLRDFNPLRLCRAGRRLYSRFCNTCFQESRHLRTELLFRRTMRKIIQQ
eukprot:6492343-Amphidinium_carterae.4